MKRTLLAVAALVFLGACFDVQDYAAFQFNVAPLDNAYLDRGEATMEVWRMSGYSCPDGQEARLYLAYANDIETPAPLALVLHPDAFDYIRSDGSTFSSQVGEDRLSVDWAATAAEKVLGMNSLGPNAHSPGALAAELIRNGFYVIIPTNCWGDLWHNTGNNLYTEGYLRYGLYLADDSVRWAGNNLEIDETRILLAGLGEGGRGIVDMIRFGWDEQAILIDSSPDYLPPIFGDPANADFVEGLDRIYGGGGLDEDELEAVVGDISLYHLVSNEGYQAPTIYIYSANDDFVDVELTRPAKSAIESLYPTDLYYPDMEIAESRHISTDTYRSDAEAVVEWLMIGWESGAF
jgi:hypothetical protein